jgi:hypothetical protein
MPDEWDSLSAASPGLADALVKLSRAAEAAGPIADAGRRKGTKPDSWEWVDRLNLAVEALAAVVEGNRDLTPCEEDCIAVIRKAGKRLRRHEVIDALYATNRIYGRSTIANALSAITSKLHLLTNSKGRGAKGYGLAEWGEGNGPSVHR